MQECVSNWQQQQDEVSRNALFVRTPSLRLPVQDGSIATFADDVFKKQVVLGNTATSALQIVEGSMGSIDEELRKATLAQNIDKLVVLPCLRSTDHNRNLFRAPTTYKVLRYHKWLGTMYTNSGRMLWRSPRG